MPTVGSFHSHFWAGPPPGGAPPPATAEPTQYPEWQTTTVFMGWPFGGLVLLGWLIQRCWRGR
jgi:hypothetical protein